MDSPPTSEFEFLDSDGRPIEHPTEWSPALLALNDDPGSWHHCYVTVNGVALDLQVRRIAGKDRIVAPWSRAGTGHYRLVVRTPRGVSSHDFRIRPEKLTTKDFEALLDDLHRQPTSISLALQAGGALEGITFKPPEHNSVATHMHRVRRAVLGTTERPGLANVLADIGRQPHRMLRTEHVWVKRERSRRPDPTRLVLALTRPDNLDEDQRPRSVVDVRVEHTLDVYENRLVKTYARMVALRLRTLRGVLGDLGYYPLVDEVDELTAALSKGIAQAAFLDEVGEQDLSRIHSTQVLIKIPAYRAAYAGRLEFIRQSHVELDDAGLDAPLENLPSLYETWGALQVVQAALEGAVAAGHRVTRQRVIHTSHGGFVARLLPDGKPALVTTSADGDTVMKVIPQRTYGKSGALRSISFSQRPDISIIVERPSGTEVFLFDPKYKLDSQWLEPDKDPRPKKVDIDKMHAYRDAIRTSAGERVVKYAATMYPGPSVSYPPGVAAIEAAPVRSVDLRSNLTTLTFSWLRT